MKLLLFILGLSFYFIFFLFSKNTEIKGAFFSHLFIEAHIYIFLALLCILGVFFTGKRKNQSQEDNVAPLPHINISREDIYSSLKLFFGKYIYYIALILFYLSLFLIFQVLLGEVNIPKILLCFNIGVIFLIFLEQRFVVFQDILRVNTALISLYYIFFHILYLFGYIQHFNFIDILNIALLGILFALFFQSQNSKHHREIFQSYALSFLFLELCVFSKYLFGTSILTLELGSFIFSLCFLVFTSYIQQYFYISVPLIRTWGLIFAYICIVFCSIELREYQHMNYLYIFFIFLLSPLLYVFHQNFENYISLLFSLFGLILFCYFIYSQILLKESEVYISLFFLSFSWGLLFLDLFLKKGHRYDTYFFHTISLIVNLFGVFGFFFLYDFSILNIGILLACESLYLFFSYYSLQKNGIGQHFHSK